ncbi:hypothetical protein M5D96_000263, partial [Drosophila gunungcola]
EIRVCEGCFVVDVESIVAITSCLVRTLPVRRNFMTKSLRISPWRCCCRRILDRIHTLCRLFVSVIVDYFSFRRAINFDFGSLTLQSSTNKLIYPLHRRNETASLIAPQSWQGTQFRLVAT